MKKSLLAVAAMGAFASVAQAQSSVTVYGILDIGYMGGNVRNANNLNATTGGTVANTQTSSIGQSAQSTSRLGFKGTEDLGGGLSAFFTIETALTPENAQAISVSTNTANRQTFVGLKKNGIGQFALGTQYTTIHNAVGATDPGQANNMMGNVIYDKAAGTTAMTGTTSSAAGAVTAGTAQFSGGQDNTSYTVRSSNMLSFASDNFAGFQGNAFYVAGNNGANNSTTNAGVVATGSSGYTGGKSDTTGWGLGVNYTWQKLLVTANFQNFTNKSPYTVTNSNGQYSVGNPIQGYFGGSVVGGTNTNDNQQYYAATYDFGILKAYAQYVARKTMDVNNSNNNINRTAQQIGVRSFITPTVEAWASTGNGKISFASAQANSSTFVSTSSAGVGSANFGGFQLGSNYYLSKRTNLYAIYGQQRTSNATYNTSGSRTSFNSNDYAVGVRHTF
jgi:predicted porin